MLLPIFSCLSNTDEYAQIVSELKYYLSKNHDHFEITEKVQWRSYEGVMGARPPLQILFVMF